MIKIPADDLVEGHLVLFGPTEAAHHVGVDAVTLNRWRRDGWLLGYPFGRGWLYTERQLDDAIVARGRDRMEANVIYEEVTTRGK
jgi:predicted site-specific integrase-resolvase